MEKEIFIILGIKNPNSSQIEAIKEIVVKYSYLELIEQAKNMMLWWSEGRRKIKRPVTAYKNWILKCEKMRSDKLEAAEKLTNLKEWKSQPSIPIQNETLLKMRTELKQKMSS